LAAAQRASVEVLELEVSEVEKDFAADWVLVVEQMAFEAANFEVEVFVADLASELAEVSGAGVDPEDEARHVADSVVEEAVEVDSALEAGPDSEPD
jgi:hypothetical protein